MRFQGLEISPPDDFAVEESSLTLRAPPGETESRLLQKQLPIRANLIVNRRHVGPEAPLAILTAEVTAELASSVEGLKDLKTESFTFVDNVEGMLVSFRFDFREAAAVRQFHALRLDDGVFTNLTLTVDGLKLDDRTKAAHMATLASARIQETP